MRFIQDDLQGPLHKGLPTMKQRDIRGPCRCS